MKVLVGIFILMCLWNSKSFAHVDEDVRKAEAFQVCVEDCIAFEESGYALRACIESCKRKYNLDSSKPMYCNTDEEDCERDNDDSSL